MGRRKGKLVLLFDFSGRISKEKKTRELICALVHVAPRSYFGPNKVQVSLTEIYY